MTLSSGDRWTLVAACWALYTLHWTPYIVREHFPAMSLARDRTLDVSTYVGWTDDVFVAPTGRAVINNNPGASLLGAVPLVVAAPALDRIERYNAVRPERQTNDRLTSTLYRRAVDARLELVLLAVAWLTVAGVMAPLTALSALVVARAAAAAGASRAATLAIAFLYALGTPVFFRTGYLNHNLLVGHAGIAGLVWIWLGGDRPHARLALGTGLLGGLALLGDFSGGLVGAALVTYLVWRARPHGTTTVLRQAGLFALGAVPGVAALAAYHWYAFGNPWLPSQHYMPPTAPTGAGYRGLAWPAVDLAWASLFDPRFGLFVYAPWLAVGLAAPWVRRGHVPAHARRVLLGYVAAFVLFCAANRYTALQWTTGLRYLVPVAAPLLLLTADVVSAWPARVRRAGITIALAASWLTAVTHLPPHRALGAALQLDLQFTSVRRLWELGLIDTPALWSATGVAATGAIAWVIRQRIQSCAS